MADITREANVSSRAFYYHFPTKESLLIEAVQPVADALVEIVRRTMTTYHPREWRTATAVMLQEIFEWADDHADEATLYYVWSRLGLPAVAAIRDQVLATCVELGTPPTPATPPRSKATHYSQALARVVAVDTADEVMSALFAGDTFGPTIARGDVARALADNNGALISERRAGTARELVTAASSGAPPARPEAGSASEVPHGEGSRRPRVAHRPSRRDDLTRAAAAAFAAQGVADTTVADVASRAGMAPNAVYYHYSSKHELFLDVLEIVNRQVADAIVPRSVTTDASANKGADLLAAWDRFSRWTERFPDHARIHLTASAAISVDSERGRRTAQLAVVERTKAWMRAGAEASITDIDAHVGAIALADLFRRASAITLFGDGRSAALDVAVVDVGLRILAGAGAAGEV